ncbi:hypothetical protein TEA_005231 [Camellia sinensis var. sinensis]|uniref:Uncharacterized protein n=1 Tax=Camellia sinensis var. sinensis TaxID=542762 RepID=A0A4S4DTM1_CAMSN|nr:hypothetical protein TEA_005231 [Camellia sinensis var. sinensis]
MLDLGGNNFINGQFPSSIGHLKNLEKLHLRDCNFSGTIPISLKNLTLLIWLDLSDNNFEGPIPQLFFNFSQLFFIDFSNNQLTGPIPLSITGLPNRNKVLYMLDLSNNHLNEELNLLCNLHSLRYLDLSNNQFGGLIPTCLGNFSGYLTVLNLQSNNFSGTIPQTFGYASKLLELDISNNGLQGVLPRSLANCTNLEILNLGHNFIEDAFPFWLENLPQLKIIVLRDNKFQGPIEQPRKRLAFTNLHIIDMSHNEFTGTLPSKFFESMHSMMMDEEDKSSSHYMRNGYGYYSIAESPTLPSSFSHNFKFKFDGFGWEAVLMGYGCGVLLGLLIGSYIIRRKEEWLVRIFGVKMCQHGKRSKKVQKKIAHTKSIINCS